MSRGCRIRIAPLAQADILEIERYLRQEAGALTALRAMQRVLQKLDLLALFPESGRVQATLDGSPRLATVQPWLILYEHDEARHLIRVRRVVHSRRDLADLAR